MIWRNWLVAVLGTLVSVGLIVQPAMAAQSPPVRNFSGGSYGFNGPEGLATDGSHIWVANSFGNSVTELDATTGAWIRTLSG